MSKKNDKNPATGKNKPATNTPAAPKAVFKWAISAKDGKKSVIFEEEKVSLPYVTADEIEQHISNAVKELQRISSKRVREEALARKADKDQGPKANPNSGDPQVGPDANLDKPTK